MEQWKGNPRRKSQAIPSGERLENRNLLTGGGGNIFALVSSSIDTPGAQVTHTFTIDPVHFSAPKRTMMLGIDVAPMSGSSVDPRIVSVQKGGATPSGPHPQLKVSRVSNNAAVVVPVSVTSQTNRYTTTVQGQSNTTGKLVLGYYLPGDVDGDGSVSAQDVLAVTADLGSTISDQNYKFDADANRDGQITIADLKLAKQNLGVTTNILPAVTANLDPISDSGELDRVTVYQDVIFEGQSAPGAQITYSEVDQKTPEKTVTAGSDGTYTVTIPLAEGSNTFHVTASDAFGQVISGTIAPVTYEKPAEPVASPTKPAATTDSNTNTSGQNAADPPQYVQLMKRNPKWFQSHPDQAAKLRERLLAQNQG